MAQEPEIEKQSKEAKKLAVGFAHSLLEMYAEHRFSPAEFRSFLDSAWDLWSHNPNRKRFVEKLNEYFDELEQQRKSPFKIGRYIAKQLEN